MGKGHKVIISNLEDAAKYIHELKQIGRFQITLRFAVKAICHAFDADAVTSLVRILSAKLFQIL